MTTNKIELNEYTQKQLVQLFRYRLICMGMRIKAAQELASDKVKKSFKTARAGDTFVLEFYALWSSLNGLFDALGIPRVTEEEFDFAADLLFTGSPHVRTTDNSISLLLTKREIKNFHRLARMAKANVNESKLLNLIDKDIFDDDDFAF